MELKQTISNGVILIEIMGGIDNDSSEDLKKHFVEIQEKDFEEAHFDLKNVPFITSSGIGKFLLLYKELVSKGKKMKIVAINNELLELFKSIKLDKLIPIE